MPEFIKTSVHFREWLENVPFFNPSSARKTGCGLPVLSGQSRPSHAVCGGWESSRQSLCCRAARLALNAEYQNATAKSKKRIRLGSVKKKPQLCVGGGRVYAKAPNFLVNLPEWLLK